MIANISIMYAWFSKKQRDNWNMFYREVSNNKVQKKHIYYIDYSFFQFLLLINCFLDIY